MPVLNWVGKDQIISHHKKVPYRVLNGVYTYDKSGQHEYDGAVNNMIIQGDNLDALKSLLPKYEGKIKCIYIDPPYNTGNKDWCYNDNVDAPLFQKWLQDALKEKESERYVHIDDLNRHDKWLCMMYPRLNLLYKLLSQDGAIFISIDDNECSNLKQLCDEIFGERNFVNTIIWEKRYSPQNAVKWFSESHDFILVYAKDKELWHPHLLQRSEEMNARYTNRDNDPRGAWKAENSTAQAGHGTPTQFYDLIAPNGKIHKLPPGRCWVYTEPVMRKMIEDNRIWFGKDGNNVPAIKRFLTEVKQGMACQTIWKYQEVGHSQEGTKELKAIFGDIPFDTPKPTRLIERIIELSTDPGDIVLDSFAGSGTTAHAVINVNRKDSGERKFILIETMDYAEKTTAERIKRIISGHNTLDSLTESFSYYTLGDKLMIDGVLNEKIPLETIREYIFYTETRSNYDKKVTDGYYLGISNGTAYYFYYEPESETTLNEESFNAIRKNAESHVIFADSCSLSKDQMHKLGIIFKKIPRDISQL